MLFLVACLPVVTIPAALCGLHSVVQRYYRDIYSTTIWRDFFKEFRDDFLKRTGLCLLVVAIPALIAYLISGFVNSVFSLALYAVAVLAALIVLTWFIPQLVLLNLDPVQALKNALIFTAVETKINFCFMVMYAVSLTVMTYIWPLSAFLLVILPVLLVLLITGWTMPVFQLRLIQEQT